MSEVSQFTLCSISMSLILRLAWISWLNVSIILATLSLGLFNASKDDIARKFAYVYAFISVAILVSWYMRYPHLYLTIVRKIYGYALYQHRISMIRRRDPGHFGMNFHLSFILSPKLILPLPPPRFCGRSHHSQYCSLLCCPCKLYYPWWVFLFLA